MVDGFLLLSVDEGWMDGFLLLSFGGGGNSVDVDRYPGERRSDEFILVVRSAAARVGSCASNAETPAVYRKSLLGDVCPPVLVCGSTGQGNVPALLNHRPPQGRNPRTGQRRLAWVDVCWMRSGGRGAVRHRAFLPGSG